MSELGPSSLAITIYRGTIKRLRFSLVNTVDADGNAIDITGWTTQFTIRKEGKTADPPMYLKAGTVTGGKFVVTLSKSDTLALKVGTFACSFERIDAGNEDLLGIGSCNVLYDVKNAR